jgi:hypothetical protein
MSTQQIDFAMNFDEVTQDEADKKLFVVFYRDAVHNEVKSIEAGRPIFDDVDLIRIHSPGSRDTVVAMAHDGYTHRFPRQWAQYQQGLEQIGSGTPLKSVTWLTPAQIAELVALNVRSVEDLATMPDNMTRKMMNHQALKQQATAYLEAAKGAAPMLKMQDELKKRDETIAELQKAVKAMQEAQAAKK